LVEAPVAIAARFDLKLPVGSLSAAGGSADSTRASAWGHLALGVLATLHGWSPQPAFSRLSRPRPCSPSPGTYRRVSRELEVLGTTFLIEDGALSAARARGLAIAGPVDEDALLSSGSTPAPRHNHISFGLRRGRFSFWLSEDFTPGSNGTAPRLGWSRTPRTS